ncbi:major facilitator superfamily domain-containing protein [Chaetomium sp. MPI-CAGE-AT-0009]|nr:major facilitator superfamily domain-containing protein [Chaetomium sp. MPI-CAGE-AT-0009]
MSNQGTGGQDAVDFPNRGPVVFAVTTATLALATLFVAARMVSRAGIVRRTAWDDYTILLAWLIAVFLSMSIDLGAKNGLGRHDKDIEPEKTGVLRTCEYVFSILYNPALMASKTSILIFYLRLSKNTLQVLRLSSWAVLGIVNVAGTILTFMNIFQCDPTRAAWDVRVQAARCIPLLTEFICSAPVNITTDLAILALPIPVLTGMRLPQRQKTILVMTFGLGIFVTIVDVIRIYYLQRAIDHVPTTSSDPMGTFGRSPGFSWNASLSLMWSAVEVNVGIICACIPTLKPLIIRILPAMLVDPDRTLRSGTHTTTGSSSNSATKDDHQRGSVSIGAMLATTSLTPPAPTLSLTPPADADAPTPASASDDISIRDFLSTTSPPSTQPPPPPPTSTITIPNLPSHTSHHHDHHQATFITLPHAKNLLTTTPAESLRYGTLASILFFLWGFSYGLLNTLNSAVAAVANISRAQALSLTAVYFGGGGVRVKRRRGKREGDESVGGFKATFMVGLLLYGVGTMMFWPGAVVRSYAGFMASTFVVGFGLAVLETAANPFMVLCGPPEYADARLLLAQGVQAVGSVLSNVLADRVFFAARFEGHNGQANSNTLIDVQWTYLSIALLTVLLALLFYYVPLPEVSDAELAELAARSPVDPNQKSIGGISLRTWIVGLAVLAQWCYVAAQENMSLFFEQLITSFTPNPSLALATSQSGLRPPGLTLSLPNYLLIAHTAFALSRFLAGGLCILHAHHHHHTPKTYLPTPRTLLLLCTTLTSLLALTTVLLPTPQTSPNTTTIPLTLFYFFEGPIWPLLFSLGLRGQGTRTKQASAWLTMGGSGPLVWPFVAYGIIQGGGSVQVSVVVIVVLMAVAGAFPGFLGVLGPKKARPYQHVA